MPADFSALIDTLLVLAGLVLVATGLVMFIYSKTSTQASSVEAFGIKLNVTHPSLILVLAGVGLMLAPRLLPGLPGKAEDKPAPAVVAAADTPPAAAPEPSGTSVPAAVQPAPGIPAARVPQAEAPIKAAAVPTPRAAPTEKPQRAAAAPTPAKVTPRKEAARPVSSSTAPSSAASPAPASTAVPAARPESAVPPPAAATPARPTFVYAALGLPSHHGFWSGETRASYTRRVRTVLQTAGRDMLRMEPRGLELSQSDFDAWWNESSAHPRSRELCAAPPAPRALLLARAETPFAYSSVESAFWPELRLRLFVCANQRLYQQRKTLSPQNGDVWPFSTELNSEIERFVRAYRNDLAD